MCGATGTRVPGTARPLPKPWGLRWQETSPQPQLVTSGGGARWVVAAPGRAAGLGFPGRRRGAADQGLRRRAGQSRVPEGGELAPTEGLPGGRPD
jgi:hypothetical protein